MNKFLQALILALGLSSLLLVGCENENKEDNFKQETIEPEFKDSNPLHPSINGFYFKSWYVLLC